MKGLGRIKVEGTIHSKSGGKRLEIEVSKFKVKLSSGDRELTLTFEKPLLELDFNEKLRSKLSLIDYARFSWLLVRLGRDLRRLDLTLVAKNCGKTFLIVGKKGV